MPENQSMNKLVQALKLPDETAREKVRAKLIDFGQRAIPHLTMAVRDESLAEEAIKTLKGMTPLQAVEGLHNILNRDHISDKTRELARAAMADIREKLCVEIDLKVTQKWKKCVLHLEHSWSSSPCGWAYVTVEITYRSGAVDKHSYENVDVDEFLARLREAGLYKKSESSYRELVTYTYLRR